MRFFVIGFSGFMMAAVEFVPFQRHVLARLPLLAKLRQHAIFCSSPCGDNIEPKKKEKEKKRKLLIACEVAEIVINKEIRNGKEPLASANMQGERKIHLAELVVNREQSLSTKCLKLHGKWKLQKRGRNGN